MTTVLEERKVGGESQALPVCYVCEELVGDFNNAYHVAEDLWRHIGCDPMTKTSRPKPGVTPKRKDSWWQIEDKRAKNLKAIKEIFSGHEYTFRDYGVVVTDYDVDVINSETGKFRTVEERDKRLTHLIHYWVVAVVKAAKTQRGEDVDLKVVGCPNFQSFYERALKRSWRVKTDKPNLKDQVIDYIKTKVTVTRGKLARRFKVSADEITGLLNEPVSRGEIKHIRSTYYV